MTELFDCGPTWEAALLDDCSAAALMVFSDFLADDGEYERAELIRALAATGKQPLVLSGVVFPSVFWCYGYPGGYRHIIDRYVFNCLPGWRQKNHPFRRVWRKRRKSASAKSFGKAEYRSDLGPGAMVVAALFDAAEAFQRRAEQVAELQRMNPAYREVSQ